MHRVKFGRKINSFGYVGILVSGVGLIVYGRKKIKHYAFDSVLANSSEFETLSTSQPKLQLKQVQVFFRHGARTPLHTLEGYRQALYHTDLHMRPHELTLFPYERVLEKTYEPVDWSGYEHSLRRKYLLRGGQIPGYLTNFGQEQMYMLGLRVKENYGDQLPLKSYNPDSVYLISTNITRTVESARCVLAGIYGNEELKNYATNHGPIKMFVTEEGKNMLIPDTSNCKVLRDVNHAAMLHFDSDPNLKRNREEIEKYIDEQHDTHQLIFAKAQGRLNQYFSSASKTNENKLSHLSYNSDRQLYNHDPVLQSLLHDRDLAIHQIDKFWQNVISNHSLFFGKLSKEENQALAYLKKIEVETFSLQSGKGYRFKFHFDANPYFHNTTLCKEIIQSPNNNTNCTSTPIKWQKGKELYQQQKSRCKDDGHASSTVSFFSWYSDPVQMEHDAIGNALKDEIWKNPLELYKHVSYAMDHSTTKKLNFVFFRDDMVARETHGWSYPPDLSQFKDMTVRNATRMLYEAMSGRHVLERPMVTKLAVGRLLKDMVERMEVAVEGTSPTRLVLYSSHDSTMASFLESLGIWDHVWPPFGSDIRLELYQDAEDEQYYVKVLYNGQEKRIRGQDRVLIKLCDFISAVKPYVIDQQNFETICASSFLEKVAKDMLYHEEGEKLDEEESIQQSETPAGM